MDNGEPNTAEDEEEQGAGSSDRGCDKVKSGDANVEHWN